MAPPLALGEVPEEVRMNKLIGMNAPPAAKVYNEKERYHVEWKDLHMTQEEQDRIAYLRERGAKHVFTCVQVNLAIEKWRSTGRTRRKFDFHTGVHALRIGGAISTLARP